MSWIVRAHVGRLVEGRPLALATAEDALAYCNEFRALVPFVPGGRALICADYRRIAIFPPACADELSRLMADMNPHIERSGVLVAPDNATGALQVGRVLREAHLETRRRFTDPDDMLRWFAEIATPRELARLREFLAERA